MEIEVVSGLLAESIDSELSACSREFSAAELALCLSPYVQYAAAWFDKFTALMEVGAYSGMQPNVEDLCQFAARSLFHTEDKIMAQPVKFIESLGLDEESLVAFRDEVEQLGCERPLGVAQFEPQGASAAGKLRESIYFGLVRLVMPRRGGIVFLDAISKWASLALMMHSRRSVVVLQRGSETEMQVDTELRQRIAAALFADPLLSPRQSLIGAISVALISPGLLEGLRGSLRKAEKAMDIQPVVVVFCLAPFYSPVDLIWIAIQRAKGATVYGMQHGGYYGEGIASPIHKSERRISDRYLTYGWSYREDEIPIDSIRLSRSLPRVSASRVADSILLVLENITALQDFRDVNRPLEISTKMKAIGTVLGQMKERALIGKVSVRFHPLNKCRYQMEMARRYLPFADLNGAAVGPLSEHSQRAGVCVFDSIGATGALECLSQGTSIVVFEPKFRERICPGAQPLYENLALARLVATDEATLMEGIQAGLNAARGACDGRYASAFLEYKRQHARASRNWIARLGQFLRSISLPDGRQKFSKDRVSIK